jgi:hypothetical protein
MDEDRCGIFPALCCGSSFHLYGFRFLWGSNSRNARGFPFPTGTGGLTEAFSEFGLCGAKRNMPAEVCRKYLENPAGLGGPAPSAKKIFPGVKDYLFTPVPVADWGEI